ncbi:unnamed protein product [Mytilus coruscus]|uniref:EF-hand domain-containing protein n=1 Tax=Mytilus coruscus TaxID=42192 RepID=A0A6J8BY31_MYTCO|nr:unnamed protein product [Mytilus coruscus]
MFKATKYTINGETNTYVDGGLLCNYPIHCFDGWWLSMKPEDGYLDKLQPLEAIPHLLERKCRFAYDPKTNKTLGVTVFSDYESGVFRYALEKRLGVHIDKFPDTKLARQVLKKHNIDGDEVIDREEFINAFQDEELTKVHANLLFGEHCSAGLAFDAIDKDRNGEIEFCELKEFIESSGICLQQRFLGYQRQEITGFFSFFNVLQDALLLNVKRVFVEAKDLDRTVGINTGHVGTMDFQLEPEDRAYAIEQGRRSMLSFLKYYAASKNLKKRKRIESISEEESHTAKVVMLSLSGGEAMPVEEDLGPPMEISQADFEKLKRRHGEDKEGKVIEISENEFNELKEKVGGDTGTSIKDVNIPESFLVGDWREIKTGEDGEWIPVPSPIHNVPSEEHTKWPNAPVDHPTNIINIPANTQTNSRRALDTQFPGVISIPLNHQTNSRHVPDTQFPGVFSIPANHQTNSRHVPDTQFSGVISIPANHQTNSRHIPDTQFPGVISIPANHQTNSRHVPDTQFSGVISIPANHQTNSRHIPDTQFPDVISIPANHQTNSRNVPDIQFPGVISIPANHQTNSRNVPDTQFPGVINIPANHQTNSRNVPDTQFPGVISIPANHQTSSRNVPDTQFPGVISIPSNHQTNFHNIPDTQFQGVLRIPTNPQTNSRHVPDTQFPGVISIPANHQTNSRNEPDNKFSNAVSIPANPRTDWEHVPVNKITGVQHVPMDRRVKKSTNDQNNWQFIPTVSSNNKHNAIPIETENACTSTRHSFTFKDKVAYKGTECWVHSGFKNKKFSFAQCPPDLLRTPSHTSPLTMPAPEVIQTEIALIERPDTPYQTQPPGRSKKKGKRTTVDPSLQQ